MKDAGNLTMSAKELDRLEIDLLTRRELRAGRQGSSRSNSKQWAPAG